MRVVLSAVLAGVVFAPASPAQQKENPVDKPVMPKLDAKEWKKLESGMRVWDAKEGKGDEVKRGAKVKVHYTGWLTNGEIFDSSVVRKEPIEFGLTGVIKGWQDGIPGMKVGGVRRLEIPAALAYGDRKVGPIPPGSTLVFEVEMLATAVDPDAPDPDAKKPEFPDQKAKEWKKLESGLEVWDVTEGKGEAVKAGATVTVHYIGWLTNGKEFDSSIGGKPVSFPLTRVIKGWTDGIPGMKPGGVRRLRIPAELGYGKDGTPDGTIPGGATLVFEVQLIK